MSLASFFSSEATFCRSSSDPSLAASAFSFSASWRSASFSARSSRRLATSFCQPSSFFLSSSLNSSLNDDSSFSCWSARVWGSISPCSESSASSFSRSAYSSSFCRSMARLESASKRFCTSSKALMQSWMSFSASPQAVLLSVLRAIVKMSSIFMRAGAKALSRRGRYMSAPACRRLSSRLAMSSFSRRSALAKLPLPSASFLPTFCACQLRGSFSACRNQPPDSWRLPFDQPR